MFLNWQKYGIEVPGGRASGNYKATCPNCRDNRGNPRDRSLSCELATGEFHCFHCGWKGCVAEEEEWERQQRREQRDKAWFNAHPIKRQRKEYRRPAPRPQPSAYSDRLLAYMASRGISEATMKALRIGEGVEPMPRKGGMPFGPMNTIQFNYYLDGELVNVKYRTGEKMFKMVQGAELLPYNVDSIKGETTCIITEGEFDAAALVEAGFKAVVSVPNGANSNLGWLDGYWEGYFADKETIYIASDSDTKGVVLRDELLRRLGAERCKVLEYGEGCKDANDHLVKYGRESLRKCVSDAREMPVEGVFTVADFEESLDALYQKGLQRGATIGLPNFDELCSFNTKTLCVVTGIPNHGKSEFLDEIAVRLNLRHGWRIAYFSPENEPTELHVARLIERLVGKRFGRGTMPMGEYDCAKRHTNANFFFINPDEDLTLANILGKARSVVRRHGIRVLVIDPYNYIEANIGAGQSKTEYVSDMLSMLKKFAKANDAIVFLVAHPTKLQKNKQTMEYDAPTLYDISDSAHFYNKADYGLSVHRHFVESYVEVNVLKVRFKHLGHKGNAFFKYNTLNGRYVPYTPGQADPVAWDNANHLVQASLAAQQAANDAATIPFGDDAPDFATTAAANNDIPY